MNPEKYFKDLIVGISIKELAAKANVSPSTVVRVLNDKPDVSNKTRDRVMALADEFNYMPNILARSLVSGRTYTVGIVVPDITNPFFPAMIKGAESTLCKAGYNVIFADSNYDQEKETQTINNFISRKVDGLIISPADSEENRAWLKTVESMGLPLVSTTKISHVSLDTVIAADREGAKMAVQHLISCGKKRILYLGNLSGDWANKERLSGYKESLEENKIEYDEKLVAGVSHGDMDSAYTAILCIMDNDPDFDAILAFDDLMAVGVKKALNERKIRVPQDVALVGFDNITLSSLPGIDLTTIDIPKYEIGAQSAALLLRRIEEKCDETVHEEIVLSPRLIIRDSCGGKLGK